MQVGQLEVMFIISFEMRSQKIQSLAFNWHFSTPRWPWRMICSIWVCRSLRVRGRCPFRIRPFFRHKDLLWNSRILLGLKDIHLDTQATLGEWHLSDGWLSWLVWCHISFNLAGQGRRVFVIALTSRRVTPWSSSGGSMQQTLERASAITFVLPWMYLISTLYLAIFRRRRLLSIVLEKWAYYAPGSAQSFLLCWNCALFSELCCPCIWIMPLGF